MKMTGKKVKKMLCVEAMVLSLAVCSVLSMGCGQIEKNKDVKQAEVTEQADETEVPSKEDYKAISKGKQDDSKHHKASEGKKKNSVGNKKKSKKASSKVDSDFKKTMDSYEAFFDEYVNFMKKYEKATDTTSMLTDYAEYMEKYAEYMEKLYAVDEKKLSAADAAYYVKVNARITKKLAKVLK